VDALLRAQVLEHRVAGRLSGQVTKWAVLVFWVSALFVAAPFAGKLTDVQDNQASSLPGGVGARDGAQPRPRPRHLVAVGA